LPLAESVPESLDTVSKTVFEFPLDTVVIPVEIPVVDKLDTIQIVSVQQNDSVFSQEKLEIVKNDTIESKEKVKKVIAYKSNNIVFLLDVSTSMNSDGKLDLLKASLIEMVKKLNENDKITLISYSTFSKVIVEGVSAKEKDLLINTIQGIRAQGMTAGGDGMKLAYRQSREHYIDGGNNQVIMATDGKFNKGSMNLDRLVEKNYDRGIKLTVLGIKNKPEDAESMEAIARVGGGRFLLIENYVDSKELLISEIKRTSVVYSK
ncbi:MAG: VWA domain-containing protein, partial [Flavobacteriales bacterium]